MSGSAPRTAALAGDARKSPRRIQSTTRISRSKPKQRLVDAGEHLRPHLQQGELEVSLDVGVGLFELVSPLFAPVTAATDAALDLVLDRAAALSQDMFQFGVAEGGVGHVHSFRRQHAGKPPPLPVQ